MKEKPRASTPKQVSKIAPLTNVKSRAHAPNREKAEDVETRLAESFAKLRGSDSEDKDF